MVEIISVDIDSLDPYLDPKGNDQLIIRDKITGKDKRVGVSTLLGSGSGDDFPEWDKDTIFNTTDKKYCIEDDRFWKSLQDGNQNHRPGDDDPETPVWWSEISESVGSAIREWAPGFYRAVDVVVKRNGNLYDLVSPVRPYESVDFEDELAAGDWVMIGKFISPAQKSVLDIQSDGSLDPGETPTTGDRYIITNAGELHANFGSITGLENNDIVEYNGSGFIVAWDASVGDVGTTAYVATFDTHYVYDVEWNAQGSSIDVGNGLIDDGGTISVGGTLTDTVAWDGDAQYDIDFSNLSEFNIETSDGADAYSYIFGDNSGYIELAGQQDSDNYSTFYIDTGIFLESYHDSNNTSTILSIIPDSYLLTTSDGDGSEDHISLGGGVELFSTDGDASGILTLGAALASLGIEDTSGNVSSITISEASMLISDDNETGFAYAADYSSTQTAGDRWIPDKGYVDSLLGSLSLEDGQGTTWNSDDSSVDLGGALTDDVLITGGFNLGLGSAAGHLGILSAYAGQIAISSGVNLGTGTEQSGNLELDASVARLRFRDTSGELSWIAIHSTGMVVQDNNLSRGLEYVADYSANYIPRSLIDKEYADTLVNDLIGAPVSTNLFSTPSATSSDGDSTGVTISGAPRGMVFVVAGTDIIPVGDGVKTKGCYFSGDGGATARAYAAIENGDTLYWNGSVVGYQLAGAEDLCIYTLDSLNLVA